MVEAISGHTRSGRIEEAAYVAQKAVGDKKQIVSGQRLHHLGRAPWTAADSIRGSKSSSRAREGIPAQRDGSAAQGPVESQGCREGTENLVRGSGGGEARATLGDRDAMREVFREH